MQSSMPLLAKALVDEAVSTRRDAGGMEMSVSAGGEVVEKKREEGKAEKGGRMTNG